MLNPQGLLSAVAWTAHRALTSESRRAYRWAGCASLALAAAITVTIAATGCSPQLNTVRDTLGPILESGWRVYTGQRPHVDFLVSSGALYCWLMGLAMHITGPNANALAWTSLLPLVPLGVYAWEVTRRRFPAGVSLLITAYVILLLTATRPLAFNDSDYGPSHALSYAMQYNRLGWSFLVVFVFQCLVAPLKGLKPDGPIMNGLAGLVAGLLIFVKITFGAAAFAILLFPVFVGDRDRRLLPLLARLAGWGVAVVGCIGAIGSSKAFLGDQAMIGAAASLQTRLEMIRVLAIQSIDSISILAIMAVACAGLLSLQPIKPDGIAWWRELAALLAIVALGLFVGSSCAQHGEIPLLTLAAFTLAEACRRWVLAGNGPSPQDPMQSPVGFGWSTILLLGLVTLWAPTAWADSFSIGYSYYRKHHDAGASDTIDVPSLKMMHIDPWQKADIGIVRDGLQLLKKRPDLTNARILSFTNYNFFPFALGLPSPRGGALCFHLNRIVNDRAHPPAERVMSEVTHVMFYHCPLDDLCGILQQEFMERAYGEYLRKHFHPVDESKLWTLWERNSE
jgi:hypothetical protein